jgi:YVTN family beta-propeller protein
VIDTTTYKMVDTNPNVSGTQSISVGSSPSALALGPDGRLYVANRGSNTVSVIDTTTYKLVDTNPNVTGTQSISVGSSPSALAVSDGKLCVVNTGSATVSVIDTSTYKLVDTNPKISGTQSISVGSSPSSVALSPDGSLAYVANGKDTVSVIDTKTNTVVRTVTIDSVAETGGHVIAVDGTHAYVTDAYDRKVRMLSLTHINTAPQRDPNAIDNPQTDETTGAVTDSLHMTDIDGDKLTFTTAAGSGPATGTVTYDAAAGTYTYTPTPATREAAAQTTGEDYDHFTVTVSDGQGATAVVPVTVTISQKSLPNIPLTTTAIDVGGGPHGVAVTGGHAYVINFSDNTVSVIDTSANTVGEPIYLDTYYGGLREVAAVAANGDHVYVVGGYDYFGIANRLVYVIDPNTNTVSDTILIDTGCNEGGCHSIYDVAASPDGERVYVASTNGYAYAIDTASGSVVDRVYTGSWFYDDKYLTVSADGSRLYVTDPRGDGVAVYDTATMDYVGGIPVGPNRFDQPHHLAVSSDGSRAYATVTVRVVEPFTGGSSNGEVITDAEGNSWSVTDTYSIVSVIDTNTNTEIATIPVRDGAWDVAVSPDGSRAYVTHDDGKTVTVIDTDTNTVIGTFTTDQGSTSAANTLTVGSDGTLYITDFADGTVYAVTVGDPSQM